MDNPQTR